MPLPLDYSGLILAIGGLGTASFGLVDVCKVFGGGPSRHGFQKIQDVVAKYIKSDTPVAWKDVLRANWMNGMALSDQKAVAKQLIKLDLKAEQAGGIATSLGLGDKFASAVGKIVAGTALEKDELDAYGRFDAILSAQLDGGYQRADQIYRNATKAWALLFSVLLAIAGGYIVLGGDPAHPDSNWLAESILAGLLATPLAPVSKDLSSALSAAVKTMQIIKK